MKVESEIKVKTELPATYLCLAASMIVLLGSMLCISISCTSSTTDFMKRRRHLHNIKLRVSPLLCGKRPAVVE